MGIQNSTFKIQIGRPRSVAFALFFLSELCVSALPFRAVAQEEPASQPAAEEAAEDDDLSRRLIKRAVSGGAEDVMSDIMDLMAEAQERLSAKLDPGAETQAVQTRVVDRLDMAIKTAMQQRRRASASPAPAEGDRRTMPDQPKPGSGDEKTAQDAAGADPNAGGPIGADAKAAEKLRGPLTESRRGWGHLPKRDRDEILQGMDEEVIERYRQQIDQYYKALGDQPEEEP